jgi:hypothetical protein
VPGASKSTNSFAAFLDLVMSVEPRLLLLSKAMKADTEVLTVLLKKLEAFRADPSDMMKALSLRPVTGLLSPSVTETIIRTFGKSVVSTLLIVTFKPFAFPLTLTVSEGSSASSEGMLKESLNAATAGCVGWKRTTTEQDAFAASATPEQLSSKIKNGGARAVWSICLMRRVPVPTFVTETDRSADLNPCALATTLPKLMSLVLSVISPLPPSLLDDPPPPPPHPNADMMKKPIIRKIGNRRQEFLHFFIITVFLSFIFGLV